MINRILTVLAIFLVIFILIILTIYIEERDELGQVSNKYVSGAPKDFNSPNVVTSVVVTYRGLDTLGEVTVLFIATAAVGFLLKRRKEYKRKQASEILRSGTSVLLGAIVVLGVYVFTHGHLSPGGGFQGGVIIASGFVLMILSDASYKTNDSLLHWLESSSGVVYVLLGLSGLLLVSNKAFIIGDGFLDPRFIGIGQYLKLFSAGAIPLIYSVIGIKVGTEISGILKNMEK